MRDSREREGEKELLPPFDNVVTTFFVSQAFETLTKFIKKLLISTIPKINDSMK